MDGDGGVVVAADDDVADPHRLVAGHLRGGSLGGEGVVEALVEGISDVPGIADEQGVFPGGAVIEVGRQGVGGHADLIAGVQTVVAAVPADRSAEPVTAPVADR
ncbi:Uncharacterised protein [Mycobacteroides abscessus]|nr:Uncharacterised protein [Mycobacteroides abscessus]